MDYRASSPSLFGLVLAGGESRRMGRDKGGIRYEGAPQATTAWRLLSSACPRAFVSINATQRGVAPYADLPTLVDASFARGPVAGLMAAWRQFADVAWLVLAVDLPRVDRELLDTLMAARDPRRIATALRHPDGMLEPLCTIWEPAARPALTAELAAGGGSMRRVLEHGSVAAVDPLEPARLASINTPADLAALGESRVGGRP